MDLSLLFEMPLWSLILPVLLVVLLLAMELGLWMGSRQRRRTADVEQASKADVTLAAMLTLLGLMLAFTVILSALMYVIIDFDLILHGFIQIDHRSLDLLVKEMEAGMC